MRGFRGSLDSSQIPQPQNTLPNHQPPDLRAHAQIPHLQPHPPPQSPQSPNPIPPPSPNRRPPDLRAHDPAGRGRGLPAQRLGRRAAGGRGGGVQPAAALPHTKGGGRLWGGGWDFGWERLGWDAIIAIPMGWISGRDRIDRVPAPHAARNQTQTPTPHLVPQLTPNPSTPNPKLCPARKWSARRATAPASCTAPSPPRPVARRRGSSTTPTPPKRCGLGVPLEALWGGHRLKLLPMRARQSNMHLGDESPRIISRHASLVATQH